MPLWLLQGGGQGLKEVKASVVSEGVIRGEGVLRKGRPRTNEETPAL